MTEWNREGSRDLNAYVSGTGTAVLFAVGVGCTLANATTYYIPLGNETSPMPSNTSLDSLQIKWDNAVVAVFTIETTNFPSRINGMYNGANDVTDFDATKGNWIAENPSSGVYISITSTDGTTGGAAVSASTVTVSGGVAGGCMFHIGNLGARRVRAKAVVTTGGVVRFSATGKNAA